VNVRAVEKKNIAGVSFMAAIGSCLEEDIDRNTAGIVKEAVGFVGYVTICASVCSDWF
jgi:hypothetical protein